MKISTNLLKQNTLWVMVGMLVLAFTAIATQSDGQTEKLDSAYVNASRSTNMHKGDKDAPVNVVVYTDFLCPYCSSFANDVMPRIDEEFIETGIAQIEVRPVAMIGLDSGVAAAAAFCAADQDQFWKFHDGLYSYVDREIVGSGANIREESVLTESVLAGILRGSDAYDEKQFATCLADGVHDDTVKQATSDATEQGVSGTPHVMINGNHIQSPSYEIMSSVIKAQS